MVDIFCNLSISTHQPGVKALLFPSVPPHWKEDVATSFCASPLGESFSLSLKLWVP